MKKVEQKVIDISKWIGSIPSLIFHTFFFIICFVAIALGADFEKVLLTLTTAVSLEAIYLSIFIQMSVNRAQAALEIAQHDIEKIGDDIEEIQEDVQGIEKDIDEIEKDIDDIQEDVEEIAEEK